MAPDIPLAGLRRGDRAAVSALPADLRQLAKLLAFGILPGTEIEILQTFPVYVLAFGHTKLAIDKIIANSIKVTKL